jgi:endonuclease I
MRNDYEGCGLPGFDGFLTPNEACNTPNAENSTDEPGPTGPVLNEFVTDHLGDPDDHEYIEIVGDPRTVYSSVCIAVIVGDQGAAGVVDYATQAGFSSGSGYWATPFLNSELEDGSFTIVVAQWSSCSAAVGSDLDSNDDGVIDSPPWGTLYDSVSVSDGDANDIAYSATVLGPGFDGVGAAVGGASRVPDGADGAAVPWMRNDFDGAGLEGFAGSLVAGEAYNTPEWRNRIGVEDYYAGVNVNSSSALRASLHDTIDDHRRFEYSDSATDTWNILGDAQEDPNDPNRILDVYKNASYPNYNGGNNDYDREHTWPKSYGFPADGPGNYPYTDCHQLMLADGDYNQDRSNHPFRSCNPSVNPGCVERPTESNNGTGGDPGSGYPGYSNWDHGSFDAGSWETWIGRRGDVARAQLYMDVRYEGGTHGITSFTEPDLILTDDNDLISDSATGYNESVAYMGMLSDLLLWHEQDPVDDDERRRNEVVYSYQGNRNPFVDHPEWVGCVFSGDCGAIFVDGFESGDTSEWSGIVR